MTTANGQLWQTLQQAKCVNVDAPLPDKPLMPPWYLIILEGIAGWIAALFLLGFIGSFLAIGFDEKMVQGSLFIGAVFVLLGAVLDRKSRAQQVFMSQLAFVFGLSGLLCVGWGLSETLGHRNELAWFICFGALLIIHSAFINNRLSVFLDGIGMAGCITGILYQWQWMSLMPLGMLVLAIVLCLSLDRLGTHYGRLCILAYACVSWTLLAQGLLILRVSGLDFFNDAIAHLSIWAGLLPWSVSLLASLIVVGYIFNQRHITLMSKAGYSTIIGLILIGFLAIPLTGLSSALLFLLLGLQLHNKVLTTLAIISIPLFISAYYYSLNVSLLEKSLLLTALGAVLLLARWGLNRYLSEPTMSSAQEAL